MNSSSTNHARGIVRIVLALRITIRLHKQLRIRFPLLVVMYVNIPVTLEIVEH